MAPTYWYRMRKVAPGLHNFSHLPFALSLYLALLLLRPGHLQAPRKLVAGWQARVQPARRKKKANSRARAWRRVILVASSLARSLLRLFSPALLACHLRLVVRGFGSLVSSSTKPWPGIWRTAAEEEEEEAALRDFKVAA